MQHHDTTKGKRRRLEPKRARLEQLRKETVRQVLAGTCVRVATRQSGFGRTSVYGWLARYRQGGWAALSSRKITGRRHRLDAAQRASVCQSVTTQTPLDCGLSSALWTRSLVGQLVERRFQVHVSRASINRLLVELGLAGHGLPFRRSGVSAERRISRPGKTIWRRSSETPLRNSKTATPISDLCSEAKRCQAEIIFLEMACGIVPAGDSTASTAVAHRLVLGIHPQGQIQFMASGDRREADAVCEFIRRLMRARLRPVFLVTSQTDFEKDAAVRECVSSFRGKLRLCVHPAAHETDGQASARSATPEAPRAVGVPVLALPVLSLGCPPPSAPQPRLIQE